MPKFVNQNAHAVRVRSGEKQTLTRLVPGQVVTADGELADQLKGTPGVSEANKEHESNWDRLSKQRSGVSDKAGDPALAMTDPGPAMAAVRKMTVSDPLQVVIGDDGAPYGPGTGTITTKDAVHAEGDPLERLHFERTGVEQARDEGQSGSTAKAPERQVAATYDEVQPVAEATAKAVSSRSRARRRNQEEGAGPVAAEGGTDGGKSSAQVADESGDDEPKS